MYVRHKQERKWRHHPTKKCPYHGTPLVYTTSRTQLVCTAPAHVGMLVATSCDYYEGVIEDTMKWSSYATRNRQYQEALSSGKATFQALQALFGRRDYWFGGQMTRNNLHYIVAFRREAGMEGYNNRAMRKAEQERLTRKGGY
jgi:hypothetical protein